MERKNFSSFREQICLFPLRIVLVFWKRNIISIIFSENGNLQFPHVKFSLNSSFVWPKLFRNMRKDNYWGNSSPPYSSSQTMQDLLNKCWKEWKLQLHKEEPWRDFALFCEQWSSCRIIRDLFTWWQNSKRLLLPPINPDNYRGHKNSPRKMSYPKEKYPLISISKISSATYFTDIPSSPQD